MDFSENWPVCIKIEIHEIHQNLRNPVSINRNPPFATKSTSIERKLIIERLIIGSDRRSDAYAIFW